MPLKDRWINKTCLVCGKQFSVRMSRQKQRPCKYCSRKCYYKAFKLGLEEMPGGAGDKNPMYGKHHSDKAKAKIGEVSRRTWTGRKHKPETIIKKKNRIRPREEREKTSISLKKYYSEHQHHCKGRPNPNKGKMLNEKAWNWKGDKYCVICGAKLFGKRRQCKTCSDICASISKSISHRGEKNINWQGGIRLKYAGFTKAVHDYIKKKFGNKCFLCGSERNLKVHHLNFNKRDSRLANLSLLCASCHAYVHIHKITPYNDYFYITGVQRYE